VPDNGGFPADQVQVDTLVSRLEGLKRGLPVATTKGARSRFKVSDDSFERRVILAHGDDVLVTLYLGSSPGMHHVHARTSKDDAVYDVDFAVFEAPDKAADWENKAILQFPEDSLEQIEVAGLTVRRVPATSADKGAGKPADSKASWQVDDAGQDEVVNPAGARDLAGKLAQLRIGAVLGTGAKPEYGMDKPALTVSVTRKGGEKLEYRIGPTGKAGYAVLKSSARPEYFRVPGYTADALIKAAGRTQLVQAAPAPTAAQADTGKPESGKSGDSQAVGSGPGTPRSGPTNQQAAGRQGAS